MFRKLTIGMWRFWFAGKGMSVETGRIFALSAIVGAFTGFVTVGFYFIIEVCRHYLSVSLGHLTLVVAAGEAAKPLFAAESFAEPRKWVMLFLPAAGAVVAALLIKWFSPFTHARGTDSAVYVYHHLKARFSAMVIPTKAVASAIVIGSGGSAGYEGPMTLIGSACGSSIARVFRLDVPTRKLLMAAGLAAGIGALFRAPLAGALFAAEIFYSNADIEYEALLPSFVASAVSYTVFSVFTGWHPLFRMPECAFDNGFRLLPYIALGFISAFGAKGYIAVFRRMDHMFKKLKINNYLKIAIGGLLTGAIGLAVPEVLGNSYGIIQRAFDCVSPNLRMAAVFLAFFFVKAVATSLTVGSGGSGGVFGPALVCGASLGAATGIVMLELLPESMGIHPAAFALVGMAGFIAAAIRTPITAIVMVAELTGNHELLLPTMWVCGISFWLTRGWTLYRSQLASRRD